MDNSSSSGRHGTHGKTKTRAYRAWCKAKTRCFNANSDKFEFYGGRGITMHPLWAESFEAFYDELGDCPEGHTLDRIDSDGNYEPGNCRWATFQTQVDNRRSSISINYKGISYQTLKQVAKAFGVDYKALYYQYVYRKLSLDSALAKVRKS